MMRFPRYLNLAQEIKITDLSWVVTDETQKIIARFEKRLDAELFMHARPAALFGPEAWPPNFLHALKTDQETRQTVQEGVGA